MSLSNRYRRRPQAVQALKTYQGQRMTDIRDFLLGSKVYLSVNEHGSFFVDTITGSLEVTPGDYVLLYDDGQVGSSPADEFEKLYEVDEWPQIESGLAYALHKIYGFSVDAAFEAVADKTIRDFLIASLKVAASNHLKADKFEKHIVAVKAEDFDIDKVLNRVNKSLEEEILKSKRSLQ